MNYNERLTMRTPDGACLIINANNEIDARQELYDKFKLACNKLAELEDKLENGTLIDVPCKVGDTVYIKGIPLIISFIHLENEISFCVQFDCEDCYKCPFYEDEVSFEGEHDCRTRGYLEFTEDDIGKTVFLTREEAEARLKELQND